MKREIILTISILSTMLAVSCTKVLDGRSGVKGDSLTFKTELMSITETTKAGFQDRCLNSVKARAEEGGRFYLSGSSYYAQEVAEYAPDKATKAQFITEINSFVAVGYNGSTEWFEKQEVQPNKKISGYEWTEGESRTFFAYSNVPEGIEPAITDAGVTLTFNEGNFPVDVASQKDIALGYYSGDGKVDDVYSYTASMAFGHPMAAIKFIKGSMTDPNITKIKSIRISGLYNAGTVSCTTSGIGDWTDLGGQIEMQQTEASAGAGLPIDSETQQIGEPFFVIPQNLNDIPIRIEMIASDGSKDYTIAGTLGGSINAGTTTVVTLTSGGPDPQYWVDMGMVSENGKKLYISRYSVNNIDNGDVEFATKETDTATKWSIEELSNIGDLSAPGVPTSFTCRLMTRNETISFAVENTKHKLVSSQYNLVCLMSKIFPYNSIIMIPQTILLCPYENNAVILGNQRAQILRNTSWGALYIVCESNEHLAPLSICAYYAGGFWDYAERYFRVTQNQKLSYIGGKDGSAYAQRVVPAYLYENNFSLLFYYDILNHFDITCSDESADLSKFPLIGSVWNKASWADFEIQYKSNPSLGTVKFQFYNND